MGKRESGTLLVILRNKQQCPECLPNARMLPNAPLPAGCPEKTGETCSPWDRVIGFMYKGRNRAHEQHDSRGDSAAARTGTGPSLVHPGIRDIANYFLEQSAISLIPTITGEEVRAAGITRPIAEYWLNFDRDAIAAGRGGATAVERVKLMARVIQLLGGGHDKQFCLPH